MDPAAQHVDFAEVERVEVVKGAFDMDSAGSLGAELKVITKTPPLGLHFTPQPEFPAKLLAGFRVLLQQLFCSAKESGGAK